MLNSEQKSNTALQPVLHKASVRRSCLFCQHYRHEEIGDSDFGAVYAKEATCSKYFDTDPETEEDIPNFDRTIERDCCVLEFWQVLEVDEVLKSSFDKEMSEKKGDNFNDTYQLFKGRYNYA